jgi:16S rRNA (guanine527-N7)-methyltransferase
MQQTAKEILRLGALSLGLALTESTQEQLLQYCLLLQQWNKAYNLTAITDLQQIVIRHLLDSLVLLPLLKNNQRILDVGTGAGLPGIPLALMLPERSFTLLDSQAKKLRFLRHVQYTLGINNVTVVQARIETYPAKPGFDCIVSRAFAALRIFLEQAEHGLNPNGIFLAMKGIYPQQELQDIPPRFTIHAVHQLQVPGLHEQRHVVEIGVKGK